MGLSFLNKKIWHPGSFANMEKTWVTEQKFREVEIRAIEKAKKIKEEKVIEEMKKIQVNKGLIPASQLNRLDFMYQCPDPESTQKANPNEDFLLGKRIDEHSNNIFLKNKNPKKSIVPMFADNYINEKNEDFIRIHEDPLYLILKEEQKQRKEIEQNPYKMKMILNDIKNDFKDSKKFNNSFDDKKEILYENKKNNAINIKEEDENKKSKNLREKSSESAETEKYVEKDYRKERDKEKEKEKYRRHHHKHREKYYIRDKSKYEEDSYDREEHKHRHSHRDSHRDREKHRSSNRKYYY